MLISGISFGLQQAKIKSLDGQCRYEYIRHDYGKEFFALQAIGFFFFFTFDYSAPFLSCFSNFLSQSLWSCHHWNITTA